MPATDSHDGQIHGATPPIPLSADPSSGKSVRDPNLFKPGDLVGGSYQIIDLLGRGAMGMVYKVKHVSMEAEYALKVLTTQQLNDNAVLRFQNEAQALAKLNHQNLIGIYNFGLHDGRLPFYVMDLLSGDNLLDKLDAHGPMPVDLALPLFIEVCAGLSYAHRKGIVHRDVKPANFVMLDSPDVRGARVKVVDFGLVKFAEELKPDIQKLTAIGEVCGSPSYMSPEQSSGQKIDPRSDVYSLGCSLFQALTGRLPFLGRNATETMMMQHEKAAPTLTSQGGGRTYPEDLERLVAKMLAKAPMDRYQTMESVAQDLRNILDGKPLGTQQALPSGADRGKIATSTGSTGPQHSAAFATTSDASASGRGRSKKGDAVTGRLRPSVERINSERTSIQRVSHEGRDKSEGGRGREGLQDETQAGAKKVKVIAIAILSICLIGGTSFFAWRGLQPAKLAPRNSQTVAAPADSGDASSSKGLENTAMPMLDGETQSEGGAKSDGDAITKLELTKAQYFSKIISVDGKQYIEFDFPKINIKQNLGLIATSISNRQRIDGKIRFPKGSSLFIVPTASCTKVPHFFDKFRPGEIAGIFLSPFYANDEVFNCAARVPGIHEVTIDGCGQLTDKIVPALCRLNLTELHARGITIDGEELARAHFWPNLKLLELSHCKNVTPILKQLSGSRKLEQLELSEAQLNATDYQLIATLPRLRRLTISHNKLTTQDLSVLSRLHNLKELLAVHTRLGDSSPAEELKQFPALTDLVICKGYIKAKDIRLLKQECPSLRVFETDSNKMNSPDDYF